jgi:hypothetical protein
MRWGTFVRPTSSPTEPEPTPRPHRESGKSPATTPSWRRQKRSGSVRVAKAGGGAECEGAEHKKKGEEQDTPGTASVPPTSDACHLPPSPYSPNRPTRPMACTTCTPHSSHRRPSRNLSHSTTGGATEPRPPHIPTSPPFNGRDAYRLSPPPSFFTHGPGSRPWGTPG